jgi:Lantibiotic dehydratase, N terminus
MDKPLFVVRIAGLPAEALDSLTGELCKSYRERCRAVEAHLDSARRELVEALYGVLGLIGSGARRLALDMKRACFNGRDIGKLAASPAWCELTACIGVQVEEVLRLEESLRNSEQEMSAAFDRGWQEESASLSLFSKDRYFMRGLSLASPDLATELHRLNEDPHRKNSRKSKRAMRSLLRYVSRATLKLSPYSTLTRIGLGVVSAEETSDTNLEIFDTEWSERSLFRAKRSLIDQCFLVLSRLPQVRRDLSLVINDTIEYLGESQYKLLRPLSVAEEPETGNLRVTPASQVKANLSGPVVEHLMQKLHGPTRSYSDVLSELMGLFGGEEELPDIKEQVTAAIDRLIDVGFLELKAPWPSYELRLEERLIPFLFSLNPTGKLLQIANLLNDLVKDGDAYPVAQEPHLVIRAMRRTIEEIWEQISELTGSRLDRALPRSTSVFYEDVFLKGQRPDDDTGAIAALAPTTAAELLSCGNAIWRIFSLFNPRHDFLLALSGLWKSQWPDRDLVPFLEVFAKAQPLWRDYVSARRRGEGEGYDPYSLPEAVLLRSARKEARHLLDTLRDNSSQFEVGQFEEISLLIPDSYDPIVGSCLFIQPANENGSLWVLNRLFEGTGKYSSRFTSVMDEPARSHFIERLKRNSVFSLSGRRIELLDILYGHENTVNLHLPQTPKVLEIPGEHAGVPPEARLSLSDLFVQLDPVSGLPIIVDAIGVRYLPCHLSAVASIYMPVLSKFLSAFGVTGYIPDIFPSWTTRQENGIMVVDRLTIGSLVFRRKRWIIPRDLLPDPSISPENFYREMNERLLTLGVDSMVFWIEPLNSGAAREGHKPQFVDFSSPLFATIFQNSPSGQSSQVTFEEVLPQREQFPPRRVNERWAVEIILDSLMERTP